MTLSATATCDVADRRWFDGGWCRVAQLARHARRPRRRRRRRRRQPHLDRHAASML